jgi:translation initiation factor 1
MGRNSRLVYSTETGRIQPQDEARVPVVPAVDGIVRIRRETKGRKGKGVTTVYGIPVNPSELKVIAKSLKKLCGSGGSLKHGVIEIQGDHRDRVMAELEKQGYSVKLAGG